MTGHERIPLSERARWQAALRGLPHAFAHTWGSCHAMHLTSGLETFLYVYDDGVHRAACPFAVRAFAGQPDLLTPYGFSGFARSGPVPDLASRWAAFARAEGFVCGYVALNPVLDDGREHAPHELHTGGAAYLLDLTQPEAERFARMSENRRRQVRAWERGGVTLVTDREALAAFFATHLRAFLDERRAARVYYLAPATLDALFALDDLTLLGAAVDGRLEAVSVFAHTPHVGDYLFNVSLPEGRRHSAPLIWHGSRQLAALGVPVLNLGGAVRAGDGVAAFKVRFGGREVPLRALRQVYAPARYEQLCRQAGADPAAAGGYFPPYHAPR